MLPPFKDPPAWVVKSLRRFCAQHFWEEIEGDLYELYQEQIERYGEDAAKRKFVLTALSYARLYFFTKNIQTTSTYLSCAMLLNTFKISWRLLRRRPIYGMINITGLALSIGAILLIVSYIRDELRYDQFHTEVEQIYRIGTDNKLPGTPWEKSACSSRKIAPALEAEYPEVVETVRMFDRWVPQLQFNNQYYTHDVFYTESEFFDVFSFVLIQGDPETVLDRPYSMVITDEMATQYFGTTDVMGNTMIWDDSLQFTITGVMEAPPRYSHITFDCLLSYATWDQAQPERASDWINYWLYTYVKLAEEAPVSLFESQIKDLVTESYGETMEEFGLEVKLGMEAFDRIYLFSDRADQAGVIGDIRNVQLFGAVALLLLIIAIINFINLSTARSMDRAKEVGLKKVIGANKRMIVQQFLLESIGITCIALGLGIVLALFILPFFNELSGKHFTKTDLLFPLFGLVCVGLIILIGLASGSYPAVVLSSFKPITVLRGKLSSSTQGIWLRRALIVFQFTISIVLIIAVIVVYRQLQYLQDKDLGFRKDQVVVIDATALETEMSQQYKEVKNELASNPAILSVSASSRVPGAGRGGGIMFPEGLPEGEGREMSYFGVDPDYIPTLDIEMLYGRNFSNGFQTDQEAILINETAAKSFGWELSQEVIGKQIVAGWNGQPLTVIGVYKDYHHLSPKAEIEPTGIIVRPNWYSYFALRFSPDKTHEVLRHLIEVWEAWYPAYPFTYFFLDKYYNRQYQADQRLTKVVGVFAVLAIFIACFGLFGMALYTVQQRTKEMGIRKVLGASSSSLFLLLYREFFLLISLGFLIAAPIGRFVLLNWLDNYAFRIELSPGIFVMAFLLAILLATIAVVYQAWSAVTANPLHSLRSE